jgi:alpha-mannosidase
VRRTFGASSLAVTYTLRAGSARVDLGFDIDWHESEQLLSLMVPLDVHAADAACDIQFGHVRRPTHPSSPWDAAKFEVCAHRYVDLAEPGFGVAVLNNGRFGHCLFDGGIRVSLLRAARFSSLLSFSNPVFSLSLSHLTQNQTRQANTKSLPRSLSS